MPHSICTCTSTINVTVSHLFHFIFNASAALFWMHLGSLSMSMSFSIALPNLLSSKMTAFRAFTLSFINSLEKTEQSPNNVAVTLHACSASFALANSSAKSKSYLMFWSSRTGISFKRGRHKIRPKEYKIYSSIKASGRRGQKSLARRMVALETVATNTVILLTVTPNKCIDGEAHMA